MAEEKPKRETKAKKPTAKPKADVQATDAIPESAKDVAEAASGKIKATPKRSGKPALSKKVEPERQKSPSIKPKASAKETGIPSKQKPRLELRYSNEIRKTLMDDFKFSSPMQAPRFSKVVVNMGLGEALTNARSLETAPWQLGVITGQHPVVTKARRSIAGFKVREGQSIGCMVTLRGSRMYEFLDRLINVALPRIRDFRGVSRNAFDGQGNYSLGLRDQSIFPELDYGSIDRSRGLQVVKATTAKNDREGFRLLELIGLPFAREGQGR